MSAPDFLALIAEGEESIARRLMAGDPVPADWLKYLERLKREATRRGLLPTAPKYSPGCLYDYTAGSRVRSVLRCVAHRSCPREVVLWRTGLLAEMFTLEKLVGAARADGEREWRALGVAG